MSNLYELYKQLKEYNKEQLYLFKTGIFYIFLDEDAKTIEKYIPLKITNYNKDTEKCGFPSNAKDKYLKLINLCNLKVTIINVQNYVEVLSKLISLNIEELTPLQSINKLKELKDLIAYE